MEEKKRNISDSCPFAREHSDRLARIETKLDNALTWLSKRDEECNLLQREINSMQVEMGKQGTKIGIISTTISAVIAGTISYFLKNK